MDAYVQYAKDLAARGYSAEQIQATLSQMGLSRQVIDTILPSLGVISNQPSRQGLAMQAYVKHVVDEENQGVPLDQASAELTARGVDDLSKRVIIELAEETTATNSNTTPEQQTPIAQPTDIATNSTTPIPQPQTLAPPKASQDFSTATRELLRAAGRLESVIASELEPVTIAPIESQVIDQPAEQVVTQPLNKLKVYILIVCVIAFAGLFTWSLLCGEKKLTWLGLISMNVVGTVGFDLMLKRSNWQQVDRWLTATILQTGLFLPFLAKEIVNPIHFPPYTSFDDLLLGCAVIALISLQFFNVKALQHLEASVFSVIYNSRILFATLLGWVFLSETVGVWALLGGLLIFLAIFIVRQRANQKITKQGIIFGIGAALAMSAMNTCEKELIKMVGYEQYIFPLFTIAAVLMWLVVFLRRTKTPFSLLIQPQSLLIMALRACAGIGFSYSLVFGPVAVSSYLSSLSVVLLVVLGVLFFGERDYLKNKVVATLVAILGLTAILFDSL